MSEPNDLNADHWLRDPDFEQFRTKAAYSAWIVGAVARPKEGSAGISAAGWYIVRDDGKELPCRYVRASPEGNSDEQRAAGAAALRVLEALPAKSTIRIYTRLPWLVRALNGDIRKWRDENWRNPKAKLKESKLRNGWEIWKRIIEIMSEKQIEMVAHQGSSTDQKLIQLLRWSNVCANRALASSDIPIGIRQKYRRGNSRA